MRNLAIGELNGQLGGAIYPDAARTWPPITGAENLSPPRREFFNTQHGFIPTCKKTGVVPFQLALIAPHGRMSRSSQFTLILSSFFALFFLSTFGFLPASVAITCKVSVLTTSIVCVIAAVVKISVRILKKAKPEKLDLNSDYLRLLATRSPVELCVAFPAIEECIFRGGVQESLSWVFKRILSPSSITLLGISLPPATFAAITVASLFFGVAHAWNSHKDALYQAAATGASGMVYGFLYDRYGLGASILAHCINNTIAISLLECSKNLLKNESIRTAFDNEIRDGSS